MSIFYFPIVPAYGLNMKPSQGALLYFFDAGTSDPKASYTTDAEDIPHDVPVVADINGRFPKIYISGTYKAVITDLNGADEQTFDNLQGRDGDLIDQGTFDSNTNGGDYPAAGSKGDVYNVIEEFDLNTVSGSHSLFVDDWIYCNKNGATEIDADWDIKLGGNSRQKVVDFSSKNLIIQQTGNTTVDADADVLNVINTGGQVKRLTNVNLTFTMPTDLIAGSEKASHWYELWTDEDGLHKLVPDLNGTADADVPNSLSATGLTFVTDLVQVDDEIFQTTDNTKGYVKAVSSETVITCKDKDGNDLDLFPVGNETFVIHQLNPSGLGNYKANIGAVYNSAAGNFDFFKKTGNLTRVPRVSVLSGGTETSLAAVDLSGRIPVTAKTAYLEVQAADAGGSRATMDISPVSTASMFTLVGDFGGSNDSEVKCQVTVPIEEPQTVYYATGTSDANDIFIHIYES